GIRSEQLPLIFNLHWQAGSGRETSYVGGLGLGLTIARHIIEGHDGKIQAFSDGPQKGATFEFTLPRGKGENFSHYYHPPARRHDISVSLKGLRMLIVDDNNDVLH